MNPKKKAIVPMGTRHVPSVFLFLSLSLSRFMYDPLTMVTKIWFWQVLWNSFRGRGGGGGVKAFGAVYVFSFLGSKEVDSIDFGYGCSSIEAQVKKEVEQNGQNCLSA